MDAVRRAAKSDPTGTLPIVRRWSRDLDARWATIKRMLPVVIKERSSPVSMISHSVLTGKGDPIAGFQGWLDESFRQVILGVNGAWLLPYVRNASDAGAVHARRSVDGATVSTQSVDRTHLLQSLAIVELQGIVEATSQQLVRVFANGLLARKSPAALAGEMRNVVDSVGVRRGHLLVSFMTIKAFNSSALDGFRALGISRVGLVPERVPPVTRIGDAGKSKKGKVNVITAEDDRVCPECEEIAADGPYYIDEAEHLIPAHPRCRCAFVPADPKEREEVLGDSVTHIASGVMITADDTGRTLFVRRSGNGDQSGTWAFPGGAVEPGETVEQAAARECREEIGYDPSADLEQAHRASTNDVDFTTYMHTTDREFRPLLNDEHDAYKWALVEHAPEPLHPGVARTLDAMDHALRMRDENNFVESKHPRDKDGKFAKKGSIAESVAEFNKGKLPGDQMSFSHAGSGTDSGYDELTVFKKHVDETEAALKAHNVSYELIHHGGTSSFLIKHESTSAFDPEPAEAPLPKVAPSPEHPLQKHLKNVSGTSAERVALRKQMNSLRKQMNSAKGTDLKYLQEKHNASFWKQHQDLTKKGKLDEAKEIAGKLDKYSKTYGIANPLKQPVPIVAATVTAVAPKYNINTPEGNFAQSLHANGLGAHVHTGTFGPSSPHHGQQYVTAGLGASAKKAEEILKHHPNMEMVAEGIFKPKSAQPIAHESSAHAMAADLKKDFGKNANVENAGEYWKVSTSTLHAESMATIAKKYPDASLMPGMKSTYMVPKAVAKSPPVFGKAAPKPQQELNFADLKKVGEQKGSNPGGVYEDAHGQQFYVKSMSKERADNELLAAKLYSLTGSKTLQYVPVKSDGDTHYVATKFEKLDKDNVSKLSPSERKIAQGDFATHAWLANWDAAGTGGDNIGVKNGEVKTLDVGGALEYRAKGTPKGELFGTKVNEWDTLRQSGKNVDAAALYGDMTNAQLKESVGKLTSNVTSADIRNTVESVYGINAKSKALADKLIDRKTDLVQRAEALSGLKSAPSSIGNAKTKDQYDIDVLKAVNGWIPDPKQVANFNKQHGLDLSVAQLGALQSYIGSSYKGLNKELRKKDGQSLEIIKFAKVFDEALAKMPIHEGYTQRGIDNDTGFKIFQKYADNIGKVVTETQFTSAGIKSKLWGATTLHIQSKAARSLTMMNSEGGGEVVYRKGTHLYITKVDPKTHEIWAEEV